MRRFALALLSSVPALALALAPRQARAEELAALQERLHAAPRWGLLVSGGVPEGLAASVVFRPVPEVRLYAGPMWNYVGWGAQAGVTIIPWQLGISPFLSLEAGRYFAADVSFLAGTAGGVPEDIEPLLKHVGYDYASAHLGIEIGTRDAFALVVEAGLSYLTLTASGTASSQIDVNGTPATVTFSDPHVRGTAPSVRVGVQTWF